LNQVGAYIITSIRSKFSRGSKAAVQEQKP